MLFRSKTLNGTVNPLSLKVKEVNQDPAIYVASDLASVKSPNPKRVLNVAISLASVKSPLKR